MTVMGNGLCKPERSSAGGTSTSGGGGAASSCFKHRCGGGARVGPEVVDIPVATPKVKAAPLNEEKAFAENEKVCTTSSLEEPESICFPATGDDLRKTHLDALKDALAKRLPDPKPPKRRGLMVRTDQSAVLAQKTGRLEDHYVLGAELGRGHFGVVRSCTSCRSGQAFACKTLAKARMRHWEDREDIRREIAIMQHLSGHPNLVSIEEVFEDEKSVHLVMELCDGGELYEKLAKTGRYSEEDAAAMCLELADALAFCHHKGIMHRDLKPENILLSDSSDCSSLGRHKLPGVFARPRAKIADFGLALFIGPNQTARGSAGSPYYMAPEVVTGTYGQPADVWSLGVVLYILLCGQAPFWGPDDDQTIRAIQTKKLKFSHPAFDSVSEATKFLLCRMLDRDPTKRPTALEVRNHPWLLEISSEEAPLRLSFATYEEVVNEEILGPQQSEVSKTYAGQPEEEVVDIRPEFFGPFATDLVPEQQLRSNFAPAMAARPPLSPRKRSPSPRTEPKRPVCLPLLTPICTPDTGPPPLLPIVAIEENGSVLSNDASAALELHRIVVEGILEGKRIKTGHREMKVPVMCAPAAALPRMESQSWWTTLLGM